MTLRRQMAVLLAVVVLTGWLRSEETPHRALLVLAKRDKMMSIIDPESLKVVARIPVGNDPHEVIASADGRTAYVSNYGFGAYNSLAVVDLVGHRALPAIDLGPLRGPHGLTFVGGKAWFTAEAAKAIGSYDPVLKRVDFILGTGQDRTHMIYVSPDEKRIMTTNVNSGTVSLLEKSARPRGGPPTGGPPQAAEIRFGGLQGPPPGPPAGVPGGDWEETVVKVGQGSEGFDVLRDGTEAWVANAKDGTVSVIDMIAKRVSATLALEVPGANRLKFTPDGRLALISGRGGLTVVDVRSRTVVKRMDVGNGPAGILMQPGGQRAFVACSGSGDVAVIDLRTLEVTGRIPIGNEPDGEAWAERE